MPRSTKEMLKLDAWLALREKSGIRSTPLQRDGSVVRCARKTRRAKAVERQMRWRGKARNRRQWLRYQRNLMRARRIAQQIARQPAPTLDLQSTR